VFPGRRAAEVCGTSSILADAAFDVACGSISMSHRTTDPSARLYRPMIRGCMIATPSPRSNTVLNIRLD
jgi:hypothetical protein